MPYHWLFLGKIGDKADLLAYTGQAHGRNDLERAGSDLQSTTRLLHRYRDGELSARDELVERYLPLLQRWARGRLPKHGRDLAETDDLVQLTFLRALNNIDRFEAERPGAFLAYLRKILINQVREEIRRKKRLPPAAPLSDRVVDPGLSVVEQAVGQETVEAYEAALMRLPEGQRQAVVMRVEFGMTFPEIAAELDSESANSARMTVTRALARIAQWMP